MNNNRSLKLILYQLKRRYGVKLNIVWVVSQVVDDFTGVTTINRNSQSVDRAIVLPAHTQRDFEYDLTWIATSKNFVYGGLFDKQRRRIIIDKADVPADFEIKIGYSVIYEGKRFEVKYVNEYEAQGVFDFTVEQLTDVDLENQIELTRYTDMFLEQTVEVVVE